VDEAGVTVVTSPATSAPSEPSPPADELVSSSAARWRLGISPYGRKTIITTSAAPNTSTRYSSKLRKRSGRDATTIAPTITPARLPEPPRTTADRIRIERISVKVFGLMKVTLEA
jgi:hypothetical protein